MHQLKRISIGIAALCLAATAMAAKPIVYPAKGQTAEQQAKDDGACYVWAKQNTGVDPAAMAQAQPAPPAPPPKSGSPVAGGAVKGTLGGAAIGAVAGDTGKGAAVGAVAGTMVGARRAKQQQQAQQQQAQQQQQQAQQQQQTQTQNMDAYYRAYGACMQGRGYTIN